MSLTRVHEVELGDDGERPPAVRVDVLGRLEALGGGHVGVSGAHGQDDGVRVRDVLQDQRPDLLLDVVRLVANRNLAKGEGEGMGNVKSIKPKFSIFVCSLVFIFSLGHFALRAFIPIISSGDNITSCSIFFALP